MAKINNNTDWASYATAPPPASQRPAVVQERLAEDARKFSEDPMDPTIRHPHPHGMDDFIQRTHPNTDKKSQPSEVKPDSPVPMVTKSTTDAPLPPSSGAPALDKPSNPLVPQSFYCWRAGKLGFIDIYVKFGFTEFS